MMYDFPKMLYLKYIIVYTYSKLEQPLMKQFSVIQKLPRNTILNLLPLPHPIGNCVLCAIKDNKLLLPNVEEEKQPSMQKAKNKKRVTKEVQN